jgi:hypothetical protein
MPKNLTPLLWIEENHPEVFEQYKEMAKERKRKQAREFQKKHYKSAKENPQE